MTGSLSTGNLKAVFAFPLADRESRSRFFIGSLLCLAGMIIPIIPLLAVYGYIVNVLRQAAAVEKLTMPEWKEAGKLFLDGLRLMAAGLVYVLPGLVVFFGGMFLYMFICFLFPLAAALIDQEEGSLFVGIMGISMLLSFLVMMISMVLGTLLLFLAYVPLPAALAHFAVRDKLSAAFAWREFWPILKSNKFGFFAAWIVIFGLLFIGMIVFSISYYTICLCCLIPILGAPFNFYVMLVMAGLFGQAYREGLLAEPLAPAKLSASE